MARVNLTAGRIRDFGTENGQAFLWDSVAPGLAVRATAPSRCSTAGKKAFIFQGKLGNGRDVRITIGDVRSWGIDEAREEARTLQKMIDRGLDPRIEKQKQIASSEAERNDIKRSEEVALTVWKRYMEARCPKWSERTYSDHQRFSDGGGRKKTRGRKKDEGAVTLPGALHTLLSKPLRQLDAATVASWLASESTMRPTTAALGYRMLRAFLNWCESQADIKNYINHDACSARSVRDEIPKMKAKDDCLQREQLELWFKSVRELANPVHAVYLQSLLLTGARREELANVKWKDVDFEWKSLKIRDKVDGERVIPLTPYVAILFRSLPRSTINVGGQQVENPWLFGSPTAKSGRLQEPRIPHNRALDSAGLPHITLHGLRRSFGTLAEWVEVPTGITAQIMGHKPSAIAEKHYRKRPLDLLRKWHEKIELWILAQAKIQIVRNDDVVNV